MALINAPSLKDLAQAKINVNISNRLHILSLQEYLPWKVVLDLWNTWFQDNWFELGTHKKCSDDVDVRCITMEVFNYKLNHKLQCAIFRNAEIFSDEIFNQINGDGVVYKSISYDHTKHGPVCGHCWDMFDMELNFGSLRNKEGFQLKPQNSRIRG
nr:uncharacterized protein LOC111416126 [Onthophagus taurus]